MKYCNQREYAQHAGLSQQRISQLIKGGYLVGALKKFGKRRLIDPEKADQLLNENISQLRRKQPPARPTQAEVEAADWEAEQQPLEHSILESLRYLVKLAELDPNAVRVIQPGPGQEGTIIRYREVDGDDDGDVVLITNLSISTIFEDPADLETECQECDVPEWFLEMDKEARTRLK
ncbi:hypothetical protein [Desulfobacula sp.]|uniref:hypothetical protein n=1 Tax=Desulfobacula sp. TaxID=2593537 RepID=UPI0026241234|nr:hypothetical protein [Desulfobacula sp.]